MTEYITNFYAGLTPFYHLIYPDWKNSVAHQASVLDAIIRDVWGGSVSSILDVSCGIGTQTLGLSKLGYDMTGSDLSLEAIDRAKVEAEKQSLNVSFSVADMRRAFEHHNRQFDVVMACDNSIPHLLTDEGILSAFQQMYACTRPKGGCLISVRDYDKECVEQNRIKPYGIRKEDGICYLVFQVWDIHDKCYDLSMYIVEDKGNSDCSTHVFRSRYYMIGIPRLIELMAQAGFIDIKRIDDRFFQPVIVGRREADGIR
jgi:SAM-dependent methyltransferase